MVLLVEEILALIFRDMIEERWLRSFDGGLDLMSRLVLDAFLSLGLGVVLAACEFTPFIIWKGEDLLFFSD